MTGTVLEADLTYVGGAFQPGIRVDIDPTGTITAVGSDAPAPTTRLQGRALLPGFVNAHSHAFQRGLRGHGEQFPRGSGTFWTWRDAMYQLVATLDKRQLRSLCRDAFREMLAAGITTVGEFHYLHHIGTEPFEADRIVLEAAADVGIRIVFLSTYYRTGGINEALNQHQQRFATASLDAFWSNMDALRASCASPTQTLGVAAHSIRAVPLDELRELYDESARRALPFHMHVEEQRREIDATRAIYRLSPLALLNERLPRKHHLVAVHCTHSVPHDLGPFVSRGGGVCVCPLTEGNLGDGIPRWDALPPLAALSLGTDSNARISFLEEMRWLEYVQRLAREQRGVFVDTQGDSVAALIQIATLGGAHALGVRAGAIEVGRLADFVSIDLNHPTLAGATPETLPATMVLGSDSSVIDRVCVGGRWL